MEKLRKFKPLIAVFNGKCKRRWAAALGRSAKRHSRRVTLIFFFSSFLKASMRCSAGSCLGKSPRSWSLVCSHTRSQTVTW